MREYVANTDNVRSGTVSRIQKAHRSVALIIAPRGRIAYSLLHALEREFPRVAFEHTNDIRDVFGTFQHEVKLVLIDVELLSEIEAYSSAIQVQHDDSLIAVMLGNRHVMTSMAPERLLSTSVHAVLPMDVRLDVWLSIVRLLLTGAPYLPSSLVDAYRGRQGDGPTASTSAHRSQKAIHVGSGAVEGLTERQTQILAMVSSGLPNKIIASKLSLSENTVKVHLHNLIEKLGARNRTEAAAIYHEHQSARGP